jgi:putative transposase
VKRSRFSETEITDILKKHEFGLPPAEICRKHGVSQATFKYKAK